MYFSALFFAIKYCLTLSDEEDRVENVLEVGIKNPMSTDLGGGTISSVVRDLWQKIGKIDNKIDCTALKPFLIDQKYMF